MEIFIEVDKKKDYLASLKTSDEAKSKLHKKFRLEWTFHSNHMEGNTLTYGETQMLLFFGKAIGDHEKREFDEMEAHDVAVQMIEEWAKDTERAITESDIRQLNKIILVRPFWKEAITSEGYATKKQIVPGNYKLSPNSVRLKNGEIHEYASPEETPIMMAELMNYYNRAVIAKEHPIMTAVFFHHQFVSIHPFDDGNGRVARLLTNYILLRNHYPPIVIKTENKEEYLTVLQKADAGDHEPFMHFFIKELHWAIDISIKAAKGESIDEPGDLDKRIEILKKQLSQNDISTKKISTSSVYEIILGSLFPLFEKFENKCDKIKDLFIDYERIIHYREEGLMHQLGNKTSTWRDMTKNWLEGDIIKNHKIVNTIEYSFRLKGFKKSVTQQYMNSSLNIQFDEYSYSIRLDNDHSKTRIYPYDYILNIEEMDSIVKALIENLLNQISSAGGLNKKW
jgi:Fic family protein